LPDPRPQSVIYHHVELDRHDVLLAEAMPAESYLDTGNRGAFGNAGTAVHLHPDFAPKSWRRDACAPLVTDGAQLHAVRRQLHDRAIAQGYAIDAAPDLSVAVQGERLRPIRSRSGGFRLALPPGATCVRLLSRTGVPAETDPRSNDRRHLGLKLHRIVCRRGAAATEVGLHDGLLQSGFYPCESAAGESWRWTDGNALLLLPRTGSFDHLEIEIGTPLGRWQSPPMRARSGSGSAA
jgi:hypothetical protein